MSAKEFAMRGLALVLVPIFVLGCGGGETPPTPNDDKGKVGPGPRGDGGKPVSVFQLIAGLPENARPRDPHDAVRRDRANEWLAKHAVGRRIEHPYKLGSKQSTKRPDGLYTIKFSKTNDNGIAFDGDSFSPPIVYKTTGATPYTKMWGLWLYVGEGKDYDAPIGFDKVSEAEAERLIELGSKVVVVTGTVEKAEFIGRGLGYADQLHITLSDGSVKEASKELNDNWAR
jgi:hypothetical protein